MRRSSLTARATTIGCIEPMRLAGPSADNLGTLRSGGSRARLRWAARRESPRECILQTVRRRASFEARNRAHGRRLRRRVEQREGVDDVDVRRVDGRGGAGCREASLEEGTELGVADTGDRQQAHSSIDSRLSASRFQPWPPAPVPTQLRTRPSRSARPSSSPSSRRDATPACADAGGPGGMKRLM